MNITSTNSNELYEIVTGKSYDSAHISVADAIKKYPNSQFLKNIRNSDSFRKSESAVNTAPSSIEGIYKRDFSYVKAGVTGYGIDELASHLGGIGKRLDEAYKAGKFTDDEYAELNKSLDEYTEKLIARSERATALQAAGRDDELLLKKLSPEEYRSELESRIEKYLTDKDSKYYCKIDRDILSEMIRQVRYGVLKAFKVK